MKFKVIQIVKGNDMLTNMVNKILFFYLLIKLNLMILSGSRYDSLTWELCRAPIIEYLIRAADNGHIC